MKLFRLPLGTKHVDADVAQELEFHLEMRAEELMRSGLTYAAALARGRSSAISAKPGVSWEGSGVGARGAAPDRNGGARCCRTRASRCVRTAASRSSPPSCCCPWDS